MIINCIIFSMACILFLLGKIFRSFRNTGFIDLIWTIDWMKARIHYWLQKQWGWNLPSYNCFIRYDTVYIFWSKISNSKYTLTECPRYPRFNVVVTGLLLLSWLKTTRGYQNWQAIPSTIKQLCNERFVRIEVFQNWVKFGKFHELYSTW